MTFTANGPGEVSLGTDDRAAAVAEVKRSLRVALADDDDLIAGFAETALGLAERFLGRALIARDMTERIAASSAWQMLGALPVLSISGLSAVAGEVVTPLPVEAYAIDIDADAAGWVRTLGASGVIEVAYHAGWVATWSGIPAPVRQGAVLLAAHLYDERDSSVPPPAAVTALWRPFRSVALARAVRA
ncbi:head-tail connector protein [Sphingomonas sp.]|uniref:head-tail connector protein n=1 Tax=Sphingomonas sp. TaxID=28214 RepID=UPI002E30FEC3|nr:hypothetical protein [Sphingomonas sp.]HEX4695715.1 hypothetical protein [Sphingomonas sp.]